MEQNNWYQCGDIGIANNLITTQDGYSLDARQGKVLDEKISEIKETSSISFKEILLHDVAIDIKSGSGAYYGGINDFFANNGINHQKVVSVTMVGWGNASSLFSAYTNGSGFDRLGFISSVSQIIGEVNLRIAYLK